MTELEHKESEHQFVDRDACARCGKTGKEIAAYQLDCLPLAPSPASSSAEEAKSRPQLGEDDVLRIVLDATAECTSLLDVGCGPGKYLRRLRAERPHLRLVGLEPHRPDARAALEWAESMFCGTAPEDLRCLQAGMVDAVIALDVIEHLSPDAALETIGSMKRLARRVVVMFTPLGFADNPGHDPATDELQAHRSGWWPSDLERMGFETTVWPTFSGGPGHQPGALWGVWRHG